MYIGVISDTHGRLPEQIHSIFRGCNLILHAGDIGSPLVIAELQTIAPVSAVLGNNDRPAEYPELNYTLRSTDSAELDFFMAHTPHDIQRYLDGCTGREGAPHLPSVCIYGHTHIPLDSYIQGVRAINPGASFRPRGGSKASVVILEAAAGVITSLSFHVL